MMRRAFLQATGATLMGFWSHEDVTTTSSGVRVQDLPNNRPSFKRRYTARVNDQVSLKIELHTSYGGSTYDTSELDQRNGKWVLFDAKSPADKILDREILPIVERLCKEILEIDTAYRRGKPNEFIDEAGVKWRRVD
jgi:hypothetical protein